MNPYSLYAGIGMSPLLTKVFNDPLPKKGKSAAHKRKKKLSKKSRRRNR